jgi:hypothetical protein
MNILETLSMSSGNWQGMSQLQDPYTNSLEDSASKLTITPILKGKFIRIDYTWAYRVHQKKEPFLLATKKTLILSLPTGQITGTNRPS